LDLLGIGLLAARGEGKADRKNEKWGVPSGRLSPRPCAPPAVDLARERGKAEGRKKEGSGASISLFEKRREGKKEKGNQLLYFPTTPPT